MVFKQPESLERSSSGDELMGKLGFVIPVFLIDLLVSILRIVLEVTSKWLAAIHMGIFQASKNNKSKRRTPTEDHCEKLLCGFYLDYSGEICGEEFLILDVIKTNSTDKTQVVGKST